MPKSPPLRVLHVAAEIHPWAKTGGLADVVAALPRMQAATGIDVRLLLPGLPPIADALSSRRKILELGPLFGAGRVTLTSGRLSADGPRVYLIEAPYLYRRNGSPYQTADGHEWPDNLQRFALLGWMAAHLAAGELDPKWQPEIVHAHDWHAGLAPAYMRRHPLEQARSVFTVHNLAYQGCFPDHQFQELGLPASLVEPGAALEFHGELCFMKAGLTLANEITTVSPSYAKEIMTAEFGAGLDGVLRSRAKSLTGILNGVDYTVWDPSRDQRLIASFDSRNLAGKRRCKTALQQTGGLSERAAGPLFGVVSRLTEQKGLDLILQSVDKLVTEGAQLVVLGSGDSQLEQAFRQKAEQQRGSVHVHIGYDEDHAHRIIAGCDALLVPSRFEPCGLTQLYAMRYGTLPVVRAVGGLADTVDEEVGFCFRGADSGLGDVLARTLSCYRQPEAWQRKMRAAMLRDFSWQASAEMYLQLYRKTLTDRHPHHQDPIP